MIEWLSVAHVKAILRVTPKSDWPMVLTDLTNEIYSDSVTRFCELVRLFYFRDYK